ncbi:ATP-binding protein [Hyphomonas sp.]|uniref:PAS domain-containing sensor histidine kinase n=1 Tax=Hyphomonas sp. TaxID=87 RepID=UPI003919C8B9
MARTDDRKKPKPPAARGPDGPDDARRLKLLLPLILLLMGSGLFLKAWDERQTSEAARLMALRGEARNIALRIEARAGVAEAAIAIAEGSGLARSRAAAQTPGIDALVSLSDALQSPPGSRLGEAARAAAALSRGQKVAFSAEGDLVFRAAGTHANQIAIAPYRDVLETPSAPVFVSLHAGGYLTGLGEGALEPFARQADTARPRIFRAGMDGAATACAPVTASPLSVCLTEERPLLTLSALASFVIVFLLVAAPALALFGLVRRLSAHERARLIEQTRSGESDRILGLVMHGARAGYWEWNQAEDSFFFSDGAAALLGLSRATSLTLKEFLERAPIESRSQITSSFTKARGIGWIHLTFIAQVAPLRWIELRGSQSTDPVTGGAVFGGMMLDATDRKQAEDRVKTAERRLRAAIEGFDGPFALWDMRKRLLYWNRAFAIDFGLQDTLRPGMSHETIQIARAGSVISERQSTEDNRTSLIALRSGRWLKMIERETSDGGFMTVGVDVTPNVRNEEELRRQKEKLRRTALDLERSEGQTMELSRKLKEERDKAERAASSKSAFLANMSHELRTPLNAIIGFSEIMTSELAGPLGDPSYKEYARDILTSGQHLLDMINDILDMAKIEAGKMTISTQLIDPVDPVDAAIRMIRRRAEEKEVELILEAQQNMPDIDADHRAIRQMMLNLVSNAIKFTDPGGRITITVEQRGPDIYFGVTDTGIGIPAEDLPRLAQPFEQVSKTRDRNHEGTGLGLALTKSFAEMHGGRMQLSSIYGEGTTVAFILPIGGPLAAQYNEDARDVA